MNYKEILHAIITWCNTKISYEQDAITRVHKRIIIYAGDESKKSLIPMMKEKIKERECIKIYYMSQLELCQHLLAKSEDPDLNMLKDGYAPPMI